MQAVGMYDGNIIISTEAMLSITKWIHGVAVAKSIQKNCHSCESRNPK